MRIPDFEKVYQMGIKIKKQGLQALPYKGYNKSGLHSLVM